MILPLFDYGDVVWGDRNNQSPMKSLQIFHNKCAKLVCNMKSSDFSTKALDLLQCKTLDARRKFHRCATIYKATKNDISYSVNNLTGKDLHGIQMRSSDQYYRLPKVKTNWGKQVSSYLFIDEWSKLSANIKLAGNFDTFRQTFWISF